MKHLLRIIHITITLVIITVLLSIVASAATYGDLTYSKTNNLITITGCSTSANTVIIPSEIEGCPVTSIGNKAFYNCDNITNISIPESITTLGNSVFYDCNSLTSITIPESVTNIGYDVFLNCPVTIFCKEDSYAHTYAKSKIIHHICTDENWFPSVEHSGNCGEKAVWKLYDNYLLEIYGSGEMSNLSISSGLRSNISKIIVKENIQSISHDAFSGCENLTEVKLPSTLVTIGEDAFYNCNDLMIINIPRSVISIGERAFYNCEIRQIHIDDLYSYMNISWDSHSRPYKDSGNYIDFSLIINGLKQDSITIPDGITSIKPRTFQCINNIKSVIVPDTVTAIGTHAFSNCDNLENITIPKSVTSISDAFYESPNVTILGYSGSYAKLYADENDIPFISLGLAEFDIIYDANGGENAPASQTKIAHEDIYLSSNIPTKAGYNFIGWKTSLNGNAVYQPGDIYVTNSDLILYAEWQKNKYDINFDNIEGESETASKTVTFNDSYGILPTPTKIGYTFCGWYLEKEYTTLIDKNTIVDIADNHTLYAKWDIVHVENISLDITSLNLKIAESYLLTATATPLDALDKSVKWSSSDESVAIVDENGNVTGISSGSTTITVTTNDGNYIDKCMVNVTMVVSPVFSDHSSGFVEKGTVIKLYTPTEEAVIYYTKDGSTPNENDYIYNGAITINNDSTIKARAVAPDGGKSSVSTYEYETVYTSAQSIEVDTVGTCAGNFVEVDVLFNNNPGIHGIVATITFDNSVLALKEIKNGEIFTADEIYDSEKTASSCVIYYEKSIGDTFKDGVLTTLVFKVADTAPIGNYPVTISYSSGDIVDSNENMIITETIQGAVNIYPLVIGDINYDGIINMQDIVRFKSYFANLDVVINDRGSDVNHDGDINLLDLYAIRRFLAGLEEIGATASIMSENDFLIALPCVSAQKGEIVRFDIQLKDSVGLWGLNSLISYDNNCLQLIDIENGTVFADGDMTKGDIYSNNYALLFTNESSLTENNIKNGTLITLVFKVLKESPDGFTPISFSFDNEHIAMNVSGEKVNISTSMGFITFDDDFILPDVNNDGVFNITDLTNFISYMSDATTKIANKFAADFDDNNRINMKDLNKFMEFMKKCNLQTNE